VEGTLLVGNMLVLFYNHVVGVGVGREIINYSQIARGLGLGLGVLEDLDKQFGINVDIGFFIILG